MGPTASGKTDVAVELCARYPFDLISVDSALVYRGMDIGTAKPDAETLRKAPHRLVDILQPEERYSAGDFVRDAQREMQAVFAAGRIPLLTGGTMMYFRALTGGMAELPAADQAVRDAIDAEAEVHGWPAVHARLQEVDPESAARINANDSQRIQRALEVFEISGRSLTEWQQSSSSGIAACGSEFVKIALQIPERTVLHERIEQRLEIMFDSGFVDEMAQLMDANQPDALLVKAYLHVLGGQYEEALEIAERAASRNPNNADAHNVLAIVQNYSGDPEAALIASRHAIKLSPRMSYNLLELGHASCLLGHYEDALVALRQLLADRPYWQSARALIVVAFVGLGRMKEAREQAQEMLKINPGFSLASWSEMQPYKRASDLELYMDNLRRGGLPE